MKLLIAILSLTSSSAFAMTTTYQTLTPSTGQSEFKLGLGYRSTSVEYDSGTKIDSTGPTVPISYYYGFGDNQSLGAELTYSSLNQDYKGTSPSASAKISGLGDIFLGYKGNFDIGAPTLFIRGGMKVPPEKMKANFDTGDSNNSSGQLSVLGSAGLAMPVSMLNIGAIATYQANQDGDGEIVASGLTYSGKVKGGSSYTMTIYGEIPNAYHPNLSVIYGRSFTSNFTVTTNTGSASISSSGTEMISTAFALRFDLTPGFELTPILAYSTPLNKDKMNASKYNDFIAGVEGRMLF